MAKRQLSEQRQRFVEEYLIDLNGTQAAIRAGYSVKTAQEQSSRLLSNVMVQEAISKAMAARSKRTGVNQDRVVLELARIAFVNIEDVVDTDTGKILPNATRDDLACVEGIKYKESDNQYGGSVEREVKVASKLKALELLGKHLGMWNERMNVNLNLPVFYEGENEIEE